MQVLGQMFLKLFKIGIIFSLFTIPLKLYGLYKIGFDFSDSKSYPFIILGIIGFFIVFYLYLIKPIKNKLKK